MWTLMSTTATPIHAAPSVLQSSRHLLPNIIMYLTNSPQLIVPTYYVTIEAGVRYALDNFEKRYPTYDRIVQPRRTPRTHSSQGHSGLTIRDKPSHFRLSSTVCTIEPLTAIPPRESNPTASQKDGEWSASGTTTKVLPWQDQAKAMVIEAHYGTAYLIFILTCPKKVIQQVPGKWHTSLLSYISIDSIQPILLSLTRTQRTQVNFHHRNHNI